MRSDILILLFLCIIGLVGFCTAQCETSRTVTQKFSVANVHTLKVTSLVSSQDAVVWQQTSGSEIEVSATVFGVPTTTSTSTSTSTTTTSTTGTTGSSTTTTGGSTTGSTTTGSSTTTGGGPTGLYVLKSPNTLAVGNRIWSNNNRYYGELQSNGNFILFENGVGFWATNTSNKGPAPYVLAMQGDGNLVVYASNGPLWASNSVQSGGDFSLYLQDDRNLVIYKTGGAPIWASNTVKISKRADLTAAAVADPISLASSTTNGTLNVALSLSGSSCGSSAVVTVKIPSKISVFCDNYKCQANSAPSIGGCYHFINPAAGEMAMFSNIYSVGRTDFFWGAIEQQKGVYDFSSYASLTNTLKSYNVTPLYILDYGNTNYGAERPPNTATARAGFAAWALETMKTLGGKGIIWEMYNEPNLAGFWPPAPDAVSYAALATEVGRAIKGSYPNEMLVGPGAAQNSQSTVDIPYLESIFRLGVLEHWNLVTIHPYRQTNPETAHEDFISVRRSVHKYTPSNKTPLLVAASEWGYSVAWPAVDENNQAYWSVRAFLVGLINESPFTMYYDWRDDGTNLNEPEHTFGMVRNTYYSGRNPVYDAKPSFNSAKVLKSTLAGYRYNKQIALTTDPAINLQKDYLVLFTNDEANAPYIFVAWTVGASHSVTIPLGGVQNVIVSTMFGTRSTVATNSAGSLTVTVSEQPIYIIVSQKNNYLRILAATPRLAVDTYTHGEDVVLKVPIFNPTTSTISVSLGGTSVSIPPSKSAVLQTVIVSSASPLSKAFVNVQIASIGSFRMQTNLVRQIKYAVDTNFASSTSLSFVSKVATTGTFQGRLVVGVRRSSTPYVTQQVDWTFSGESSKTLNVTFPTGSLTQGVIYNATLIDRTTNQKMLVVPPTSVQFSSVFDSVSNFLWSTEGNSAVPASATFTKVTTPVPFSGLGVFQLTYSVGAGYRYTAMNSKTSTTIEGNNVYVVKMWVNGNNSGAHLTMRIMDSTGQTFQPSSVTVNWTGWKVIEWQIGGTSGYWGGANDGVVHYPVRFLNDFIIDYPGSAVSGSIQFTSPFSYSAI